MRGRPRAHIRTDAGSMCAPQGWASIAAAALLGSLGLTTGCGASAPMPSSSTYRPPLRVSPIALIVGPRASPAARQALLNIASTMKAPRFFGGVSVTFGDVEYQLIFTNAGSPNAFTANQTVSEELTVMPDSSATRRERVLTSPTFLTKNDRLHWDAAGKPPYASPTDHAGAEYRSRIPAGAWSFTPRGIAVTFKRARDFPTSPAALSQEVVRLLDAAQPEPPPTSILRQYGFLLATAPLTRAARRAIFEAIAKMPRIHLCGALFGTHRPRGEAFCLNGDPTSTGILIDPRTGVARVVSERVNHLTPLYPNMAVGALVDSDVFSLQPSPS
jgi:hypothetical protein